MKDSLTRFRNLSLYSLAARGPEDGLFTNSVETMLAISFSIEGAIVAHKLKGTFYAGFQQISAFAPQLDRYERLAAICGEVIVFCHLDRPIPKLPQNVQLVELPSESPMVREWFIVFASPNLRVSLLARQVDDFRPLPAPVREQPERRYEGLVTVDSNLVYDARLELDIALRRSVQEQDSWNPTLGRQPIVTYNQLLIGYLEDRNRQLSTLYRNLSEKNASLDELQAVIRTMLSRRAWEEAEAVRDGEDGRSERRNLETPELTVLISDIANFTTLSEREEPNLLVASLNHYFDLLASAVYQEGGDVDKFLGDGMLAFFAEPSSALKAAVRIQSRVSHYDGERAVRFATRIALVTGPCIVARVGSRDRQEVTILGDTVNTASRLQAHSPPGGLAMDEATYLRVSCPKLSKRSVELAGKRAPIVAHIASPECVTQIGLQVGRREDLKQGD